MPHADPPPLTAIALANGCLRNHFGKTTHGLIRGPSRFALKAVIDPDCAGQDAGTLLDGKHRDIPVFASVAHALENLPQKPQACVVGMATCGGVLTNDVLAELGAAARAGLDLINGLHHCLADVPQLVALATEHNIQLRDLRRPRPIDQLRFWTGEVRRLPTPRIAVLGTDCALGKRTTCQWLLAELHTRDLQAQMVYTGQTGWLQGVKHGFMFDATPNDFVCGELEGAVLACAADQNPDVILLEGQSALRNPSGPCGAEFLLGAAAHGVVLMHAPGRKYFGGHEDCGAQIPPVASEIALIEAYGVPVWAVAINEDGLSPQHVQEAQVQLEQELKRPVVLPLQGGIPRLAQQVMAKLAQLGN